MEQNIKQLKLFIVDLVCVTINDMKEDIKELKRSLKQFILNMRNRKKNAQNCKVWLRNSTEQQRM